MKHKSLKAADEEEKVPAEKVLATYEERKLKFPHCKRSPLMSHGNNILLPVGKYFHAQFTDEDGDCHHMREILEAAQIFDPICFSKKSTTDIVTVLHDLAEKLTVFRFRHFDKNIIKNLKKEITKLVKDAKENHDLYRIP